MGTTPTIGVPVVIVPVLSNTARSIPANRSKADPSFIKIPMRIKRPAATTCATGTASPRAQGHVMMRTLMATNAEACQSPPVMIIHPAKVASAKIWTTGA